MTATTPTRLTWNVEERSPGAHIGPTVDAVSMPARLGALVRAELELMMLAGPVVVDGGSWTFLTQRAEDPHVPADLLPLGVRTGPVAAPLPAGGRPPAIWSAVVGAARRVAYRIRSS